MEEYASLDKKYNKLKNEKKEKKKYKTKFENYASSIKKHLKIEE